MKKKLVRRITDNALIAAIYYVMTILMAGYAFYDVQFRFAEIFIFLVFFRKDFVFGVTLGCFLANLHSPLWPWDSIFGTLATLISALLVAYSRKLVMGIIYPTIINGLVIGTMLYILIESPLLPSIGLVAVGEFVVLLLGHAIFKLLSQKKEFLRLIMATRTEGEDLENE